MSKTTEILRQLREFESRNVTYVDPDGSWPIVWDRAEGVHVWDEEGRKYLDLTAAFGVAAAGHANPRVVRAGQEQMSRLMHAMGDVHPHARKAQLARELSRITFERWSGTLFANSDPSHRPQRSSASSLQLGKTIFCNSGFEAVEAALKTAILATGRHGVIAFSGAYHGLGYGTLNATQRDLFRGPFSRQLREFGSFVQFPSKPADLPVVEILVRRLFQRGWVGAVLVEPVQARGGINVPPSGFLPLLRKLCNEHGALLILDEIYTGFGRTGKWFACEHSEVVPDVICLGKALTGGFPLSACVGRSEVMDAAWPESRGEAIHTSTFLGNPVGCAMALAQIAEIDDLKLVEKSAGLGSFLLSELETRVLNLNLSIRTRGLGLMTGVELAGTDGQPRGRAAMSVIKTLLKNGYILLPEGEHGNVISLTPPLTITRQQLTDAVGAIADAVRDVAES